MSTSIFASFFDRGFTQLSAHVLNPTLSTFASFLDIPSDDPITAFWLIFTDLLVAAALLTLAFFAVFALIQWYRRKSFLKIDRELRWAILPLSLMAITYVVFEKFFILATRPNGSGEPSFPSTHTMLTATIFFVVIVALPKYIQSQKLRLILDLLMITSVILVAIGRVIANMHWPTDVIGGIIFSAIFATIYAIIIKYPTGPNSSPKIKSKHPKAHLK